MKKSMFTRLIAGSMMFSLIFSSLVPLLPVQAAEVGYAPTASTSMAAPENISTNIIQPVSVTTESRTTTAINKYNKRQNANEVAANRLFNILNGLDGVDVGQLSNAQVQALEQKVLEKKVNARNTVKSKVESFKNKKTKGGKGLQNERDIKSAGLSDFEDLKSINKDLADAISTNPDSLIDTYSNSSLEPSYLMSLQDVYIPNDARIADEWYLHRILETTKDLWTATPKSNNLPIVAVIDAGVDFTHEDLINQKWESSACINERNVSIGTCSGGYDFVDNDKDVSPSDGATHGTSVASLIAASTDNEKGLASVSKGNARIMSLRVANFGMLETDNIVRAILFAVHNGASVINMSFAGPTYSNQLNEAIKYAQDHGVVMVAAAGNFGQNLDVTPVYPASYQNTNLVTAGAIDESGNIPGWSDYGKVVDVFAPGARVLAAVPGNDYSYVYGTSFSSPLVAAYIVNRMNAGINLNNTLKTLLHVNAFKAFSKDGAVLGGGRFMTGEKLSKQDILTALQQDKNGKWWNPQSKGGEYINPKNFTLQAVNTSLGLPAMYSPGNTTSPGPTIAANTLINFRWGSVSGVSKYGIYVRDLSTNLLVVDCPSCTANTSISYTGFVLGRQYRWNMNSYDASGNNSSAYTTPFYFTVDVILPAPTSLSPGTVSSPGTTLSGTTQTFSWGAVSTAVGYQFDLINSSTGSTNTYYTTGTSYSLSLTAGQSYYWRIRTLNKSASSYGSYSPNYYFKIAAANQPPTTPVLSGASSGTAGSNYTLSFVSTDPESNTIKYRVKWNAANSSAYTEYGYYSSGITGAAANVYVAAGTYCIQAQAIDSLGNGSAVSGCKNVTIAAAPSNPPTLSVTPATQSVAVGAVAQFTVATTYVASCTISGNGWVNATMSSVNATYNTLANNVANTYTVNCVGTNSTNISKSFTVNVTAATAPKITFNAIPAVTNGTAFTLGFSAVNIPSGSTITLAPSMGNITPSTVTLSGTTYSGSVIIKSATGSITLSAKYNGAVVGTSSAFSPANGATCTASLSGLPDTVVASGNQIPTTSIESQSRIFDTANPPVNSPAYELGGLCAPANPNLTEPLPITPLSLTAPGPQISGTNISFQFKPVTGAVSYEIYLRDILTNVLYMVPVTGTAVSITGLGANKQWRWNVAAKDANGKLGWVSDVNYFTTTPNTSVIPTLNITPSAVTIAAGGAASFTITTAYINGCTLTGGGVNNYNLGTSINNVTWTISNISASTNFIISCVGQNGSTYAKTFAVTVSAAAPAATFGAIGSQVTGTQFPITITAANIPANSVISLLPSMGTIYPNSVTLSGTSYTGKVYITSATGAINIKAKYNSQIVGTSNSFTISSPSTCLSDVLSGLCVPPSPNTPPPANLSPGTIASPGPEVASVSQTFTWSPVAGSTRYAFYLRDLGTGDLIVSTENVNTNSYTYNYLGSGKKYRWNVVAFDSAGKGGWSADPVYFTVKAGLAQPARTVASLTQDELSLCLEGQSCPGVTYSVIAVDPNASSLQDLSSDLKIFTEGAEDELYVDVGAIAVGTLAITSVKQATPVIMPILEKKLGKKVVVYLGAKFIPAVGEILIIYTTAAIAVNTGEIIGKCFASPGTSSTDPDFGFQRTNPYFCGRLATRTVFIGLGGLYAKLSAVKATEYVGIKTSISKLLSSKSIPDLLANAESVKITSISSTDVKVVRGLKENARQIFDSMPNFGTTITNSTPSGAVLTRNSLDGVNSINYREFSSSVINDPTLTHQATLDVIDSIKGKIAEIKFAN